MRLFCFDVHLSAERAEEMCEIADGEGNRERCHISQGPQFVRLWEEEKGEVEVDVRR